MSLALGYISVKILLCEIYEDFLPMFPSRTFMASRLIFKSFIHLEFIFVYGVSWWLSFIFLHVSVQISQHHLLKRLFLLHFMLLPLLSNINWPWRNNWVYFWFLFCSINLCICSYASTRLFWLKWPCDIFWFQVFWSLCSPFSKLLQVLRVVHGTI